MKFVASDGVQVKLVYKSRPDIFNVATFYLKDPSELYRSGELRLTRAIQSGYPRAFEVQQIGILRRLEQSVVWRSGTYDAGRIGSEMAYSIGRNELELERLVLPDPNSPGRDLHTSDGRVVIQTRILTQTSHPSSSGLNNLIRSRLLRLTTSFERISHSIQGRKLGMQSYHT